MTERPLAPPHTTFWLPDNPSHTRTALWAVHVFHLLSERDASTLVALAEDHAAAHGWSTKRHRNYPTTDIEVAQCVAPALHNKVRPLVRDKVLPLLAAQYGFAEGELRMRDVFLVKYEAGEQDHLAAHRDGNLLSFSILLSDPCSYVGGGLRFHSLGPRCESCAGARCARCDGVGRVAISVGRGDLTTHCGKLLHEALPVTRGRRFVVVGFVHVDSPRVDRVHVALHDVANASARGAAADYEAVGKALVGVGERLVVAGGEPSGVLGIVTATIPCCSRACSEAEAEEDALTGHLFGA